MPSEREIRTDLSTQAALDAWYEARGTRRFTWETLFPPARPLPIPGHQCSVDGCIGYVRHGKRCAEHIPRSVS